jgi:drug/metabolite transporter (DMT)-like permease
LATTTGSQLGAALVLLPALPFTLPKAWPTTNILLAVIALALFSTALAYMLYFRLILTLGATRALTVTYLIPLFAMLWGALFLVESITVDMLLGCGLVLMGTAIANRQPE